MRFRIIEDSRDEFPVRTLCSALAVSPAGYYAWRARPPSLRAEENRRLLADIRRLDERHRHRYGSLRMLKAHHLVGHRFDPWFGCRSRNQTLPKISDDHPEIGAAWG